MKYPGEALCGGFVMLGELARVLGITTILLCMTGLVNFANAQVERTATPIVVNLVTPTPVGRSLLAPTVTTSPTATPVGPARLQARESAGRVNVRLEPDTNSDLLGTISFGTSYPLLRRYYLWFELSYELAPNGRAWVFSELVEVEGELDGVPAITDFAEIASAGDTAGQAEAGGDLSDSASASEDTDESRILVISSAADARQRAELAVIATPLPTFTYPPDVPTSFERVSETAREHESQSLGTVPLSDLPPLFPIAMLAGFGIVGLMISFIRR